VDDPGPSDSSDRVCCTGVGEIHRVGVGVQPLGTQLPVGVRRGVLIAHGVSTSDVDRVWETIAIHTSAGIAERRGLLAYFTHEGVGIDFGRHAEVVLKQQEAIHAHYPRLAMVRSLVDAIVEHAGRSDGAAPRYSIPGELLDERRQHGATRMEQAPAQSPWGD